MKMHPCQTLLLLLYAEVNTVLGVPIVNIDCGDVCSSTPGSSYTLSCTWSGTLTTGITWRREGTDVMLCNTGGVCFPSTAGYASGSYPNLTTATLTITSYSATTDAGNWECQDGSDPLQGCTLPSVASGSVEGKCSRTRGDYNISCFGITAHGNPPAGIDIKRGTTILASTTSGGSVSSIQTDTAGKTYSCSVTGAAAVCLTPKSVDVTCPDSTSPTTDCECEIICIVLAVLIGIVGCGCEVAAIVAIVIVYCMFQLITGTLIYELLGTPDRKKLKEKLQHGLKKLEVNHTIDGNRLTITLKNAAFNETELTCLIRNLKTIEMIVREKVFPAWAKYVILSAGLLGFLLGVIGIILQQVLCCLEECLALLILAIIALVIGVVVIIIWIAWVRTWIFYKRKKSRPEAGNSPIPLTGSQIHTTPSEKKTPRGEPPKKMLEQKVRSIDELKEIKKKPPPVFKGNGQSQNNPREPSPISQSDSVASSSDVAVHPGKTKVTPTNEPVRM